MKTLFNLAILAFIFSASFLMLAKAWAEVRRAKRDSK